MTLRLTLAAAATAILLAGCNPMHGRQARPAHAVPAGQQAVYLRGQLPPAQPVSQPVADAMVLKPPLQMPPPVVRPASAQLPPPEPSLGASYQLDAGDQLRVVVFGQDSLSREYAVDGSGFISMPLIGPVPARGATTFQVEDRIASMLRQKYVKDPKVTVEVRTYRPFFILGEVRRPGQFPYVSGMTVQTAVAIAGGYTERARESKMKLTRRQGGASATLMVPQDYPVQPGDTIYVKERLF
ncbi:MAG: polysaccharide biosynthesis/export family protein [Pseudomonadota bacterium]|nr:polysaccharide biosynthesis/export family protein [Pseudomonadota bacterium]